MKLKYKFVFMNTGDTVIGVPCGKGCSTMTALNGIDPVVRRMLELMERETTEDEIVSAVTEEFGETDVDGVRETVRGLVAMLDGAGYIINSTEGA